MFAFATSSSQTSGKAVVGGGAMVEPRVCGSAMPWVSSLTCSMDLSERLPRSPGAFASWGLRRGVRSPRLQRREQVFWSPEPGADAPGGSRERRRRRWTADARRGGANGELKLLYVGSHSSHDDPVGIGSAARLTGNDAPRTVSFLLLLR